MPFNYSNVSEYISNSNSNLLTDIVVGFMKISYIIKLRKLHHLNNGELLNMDVSMLLQ